MKVFRAFLNLSLLPLIVWNSDYRYSQPHWHNTAETNQTLLQCAIIQFFLQTKQLLMGLNRQLDWQVIRCHRTPRHALPLMGVSTVTIWLFVSRILAFSSIRTIRRTLYVSATAATCIGTIQHVNKQLWYCLFSLLSWSLLSWLLSSNSNSTSDSNISSSSIGGGLQGPQT